GRERDGHASVTNPQQIPVESSGLGLDWDWTLKIQWESSGLDWTGLDWSPVDWALHQPIWPGKRATGVHMDYVGEGKDLIVRTLLLM
ncbi:hypothetical protein K443DRAFT_91466, partial [Laccaria amethystina LaAM-08-1]